MQTTERATTKISTGIRQSQKVNRFNPEDFGKEIPREVRQSRKFRLAVSKAIKRGKKIVQRELTPSEVEQIKQEVARYV